jgi:hypothetical protein
LKFIKVRSFRQGKESLELAKKCYGCGKVGGQGSKYLMPCLTMIGYYLAIVKQSTTIL